MFLLQHYYNWQKINQQLYGAIDALAAPWYKILCLRKNNGLNSCKQLQ